MRQTIDVLCAMALALQLIQLLTGCQCLLGPSPRTIAEQECAEAKVAAVRVCPAEGWIGDCPEYKRAQRECNVLISAAEGAP